MKAFVFILLFLPGTGMPYGICIKGHISNNKGAPVPGASVVINNTGRITTADSSGIYLLCNVRRGDHFLMVSATGYKSFLKEVQARTGDTIFVDIVLTENNKTSP